MATPPAISNGGITAGIETEVGLSFPGVALAQPVSAIPFHSDVLLEMQFQPDRLTHHQEHELQPSDIVVPQTILPVRLMDLHVQIISNRIPSPRQIFWWSSCFFHIDQFILYWELPISDRDNVVILLAILSFSLRQCFL